jgi:drug/metabolite transporter (DMT)-like permease
MLNIMLPVVLGFIGALVVGATDFFGGLGAKYLGSLRVTWLSMPVGAIGFAGYFFATGGDWGQQATPDALVLGALSGLVVAVAMIFLFASLAIGPMSILSPLGALVSALVPVVWDFASGTQLSVIDYIALGIALVAVVLIAIIREENARRPGIRGILFAVISGALIGGYMIVLSLTPDESGVVPFIASRSAGAVVLTIVVGLSALWFWARTRRPVHATSIDVTSGDDGKLNWRLGVWFAVGAGLSQAFGDILILAALRSGELAIVSVVVAMYPAGTILLATLILKERLTVVQGIGLVLALGAVAMLALG